MSWFTPSFLLQQYKEPVEYVVAMKKKEQTYDKREIVAEWRVPIEGHVFKVEFEHGTSSGKRVIWIDEKELVRRDWMFRLVGDDIFKLSNLQCILRVEPAPGFRYKYSLFVDGKSYDQFTERQAKALKSWNIKYENKEYFVVLEKHSLNIWINGKLIDESVTIIKNIRVVKKRRYFDPPSFQGDFVEEGTNTEFELDGNKFMLMARQSEIPRQGIIHTLKFNDEEVPELKNET